MLVCLRRYTKPDDGLLRAELWLYSSHQYSSASRYDRQFLDSLLVSWLLIDPNYESSISRQLIFRTSNFLGERMQLSNITPSSATLGYKLVLENWRCRIPTGFSMSLQHDILLVLWLLINPNYQIIDQQAADFQNFHFFYARSM